MMSSYVIDMSMSSYVIELHHEMPNLRSFIILCITLNLSLYIAQYYEPIYTILNDAILYSNVLNIYVDMIT